MAPGKGEGIRGRAELGKWRQRCPYLSLLPTAWRNNWISILIGNKFIFLKPTLSCPQQQVTSLPLSQPRSFLNPFLLCKGCVSGWERAWQSAKGNPPQPTQPPQKHTCFVKLYDFASPLYITELQHIFKIPLKQYWACVAMWMWLTVMLNCGFKLQLTMGALGNIL